MRIAIPHQLTRDEVRQRLHDRADQIGEQMGGMAEISTQWVGDDLLQLNISAMGQEILGHIDNEEGELVFTLELPMALSFVRGFIEDAIRDKGQKLIA